MPSLPSKSRVNFAPMLLLYVSLLITFNLCLYYQCRKTKQELLSNYKSRTVVSSYGRSFCPVLTYFLTKLVSVFFSTLILFFILDHR